MKGRNRKNNQKQNDLSDSAEENYMLELERKEKEMTQISRGNIIANVPETIQKQQKTSQSQYQEQLHQVQQQIKISQGAQTFIIKMEHDGKVDPDHPALKQLDQIDELLQNSNTLKIPQTHKLSQQNIQRQPERPIVEQVQEANENEALDNPELDAGEEEEEEQEASDSSLKSLSDLVPQNRETRQRISEKLVQLNLQEGFYEQKEQLGDIQAQTKSVQQQNADSLGKLFEERAAERREQKVQQARLKEKQDNQNENEGKNVKDKFDKKDKKDFKNQKQEAKPRRYFEIQSKPIEKEVVDGPRMPSRAVRTNQPDLKQKKRKITRLNLRKKFNMMENEKQKYQRTREPRMDDYYGERVIRNKK